MKKNKDETGKVYRIHVTGGATNLSLLICVFSPDPPETLDAYIKHASVRAMSDPVLIPTMDENSKGLDVYIRAIKGAPGYEIVNRLQIHPLHRGLIGKH